MVVGQRHLNLKMSCVHRVRTLGGAGTVRVHLAQILRRHRVEEVERAFIRRRRVGARLRVGTRSEAGRGSQKTTRNLAHSNGPNCEKFRHKTIGNFTTPAKYDKTAAARQS